MVQVDLITGFLGSGKTTFMRHYARYMVQQGWNVCILENDFGAVNVDMMLLKELEGDQCELEIWATIAIWKASAAGATAIPTSAGCAPN